MPFLLRTTCGLTMRELLDPGQQRRPADPEHGPQGHFSRGRHDHLPGLLLLLPSAMKTQADAVLLFQINIVAQFGLTKQALVHMKRGSNIINTTSVTAYSPCPSPRRPLPSCATLNLELLALYRGIWRILGLCCYQGSHSLLHALPLGPAFA